MADPAQAYDKVRPCGTCPWRRTSTVGGADIPGFDLDKMRRLRNTVGRDDAFRPVMACHYSDDGDERPCVGYLARHGWSNFTVRLMAIERRVDMAAIDDACQALDLWPSFGEMLTAYEAVGGGPVE